MAQADSQIEFKLVNVDLMIKRLRAANNTIQSKVDLAAALPQLGPEIVETVENGPMFLARIVMTLAQHQCPILGTTIGAIPLIKVSLGELAKPVCLQLIHADHVIACRMAAIFPDVIDTLGDQAANEYSYLLNHKTQIVRVNAEKRFIRIMRELPSDADRRQVEEAISGGQKCFSIINRRL